MRFFLFIWMTIMPALAFSQTGNWDEYNSSLLLEVTRPNGIFTCTGVAVSTTLIVTAAHCLDGEILKIKVFTGSSYDPKNKFFNVKKFKLHPDYHPKNSHYKSDVAKIYLEDKLPDFIKIFPIYKNAIVFGDIYRFGFGERNKKNIRTVITPKFKYMNLKDHVVELNDTFSYQGDSGGPIYLKQGTTTYILAIHSTLSFGPEGKYSYNPLLGSYDQWIFEN